MTNRVVVATCAQWAWNESSRVMGENLANAIGYGAHSHVHIPTNGKGLIACLEQARFFIMHTHGSPEYFTDQREDGSMPNIASLASIKKFPNFPNLKLVIITACSTAGGNADNNIACELSKHIATNGLVIANKYVTWGSNYDFGEKQGVPGWVAYQNGNLVLTEKDIPAKITMADGYRIYQEFTSRKN